MAKNLEEALQILGIEKYGQDIFNSSSTGELFYLQDYFMLAKELKNPKEWFPEWFEAVIKEAKESWERPESVFQHISKILKTHIKLIREQESSNKSK